MARKLFRIGRQRWEQRDGKFQPVLLEEHVVRELIVRLWQNGIKVHRIKERIPGRGTLSTPGIPDLVGWIPRGFPRTAEWKIGTVTHHGYPAAPLFIEVKRPGGVRRPAQIRFIDEAVQDGCVAFFADSWECCLGELKKFCIDLGAGGRADIVRPK